MIQALRTLMRDLEDGPLHLVLLATLVARVLGVLHLVGEFEKGVLDVVEAIRWRLSRLCAPHRWHGNKLSAGVKEI